MIAIDPRRIYDYILLDERKLPQEEQTVFHIRPLTAAQRAEVEDCVHSASGALALGTQKLAILRHGLVGWRNLKGEDGKDIPFAATPADGRLDLIPAEARLELCNAISEWPKYK